MTGAAKRATQMLRTASRAAVAPLRDSGEDGVSFSKTVAAVIVFVWVLAILARIVAGLHMVEAAAHTPGANLILPSFTWQDVSIIALVVIASHGRSMIRYALSRSSVGIGAKVDADPAGFTGAWSAIQPAFHGATPEPPAEPSAPAAPAVRPSRGGDLLLDDERGDFTDREVVGPND